MKRTPRNNSRKTNKEAWELTKGQLLARIDSLKAYAPSVNNDPAVLAEIAECEAELATR